MLPLTVDTIKDYGVGFTVTTVHYSDPYALDRKFLSSQAIWFTKWLPEINFWDVFQCYKQHESTWASARNCLRVEIKKPDRLYFCSRATLRFHA